MDAGRVAGGQYAEHVTPSGPQGSAFGTDGAPSAGRADGPRGADRVLGGRQGFGHHVCTRAGYLHRQAGDALGQLDVGGEVQSGDGRGGEQLGGPLEGREALGEGQRGDGALRCDRTDDEQPRHHAQLRDGDACGVGDEFGAARGVFAVGAERTQR